MRPSSVLILVFLAVGLALIGQAVFGADRAASNPIIQQDTSR